MQHEAVDLANGGMVAVLLGRDRDCPSEFKYHPQVQVVDSTKVGVGQLATMMPGNTRIAIVTGEVQPPLFAAFKRWCSQHNVVYLPRATEPAVKTELQKLLANKPVVDVAPPLASRMGEVVRISEAKDAAAAKADKAPTHAARGSVTALVAEVPAEELARRGVAELARELFDRARQRGISTTLGSLQQQIRTSKRKRGLSDRPLSATPENERLSALATLDHAIDALTKLRDYVARIEEESAKKDKAIADFRAKMTLMQEAFKALE